MTSSQTNALINYLKNNKFAANDQDSINKLIQVVDGLFTGAPDKREGIHDIKFDMPATYGWAEPLTDALTINKEGFKEGVTQLVIHQGDDPDIGNLPDVIVIAGAYDDSTTNYIMFHAVAENMILVTISKQV